MESTGIPMESTGIPYGIHWNSIWNPLDSIGIGNSWYIPYGFLRESTGLHMELHRNSIGVIYFYGFHMESRGIPVDSGLSQPLGVLLLLLCNNKNNIARGLNSQQTI
jgi:hypothetical protein